MIFKLLNNVLNFPFNCYMSWYVHGNGLHDGGFHVLLMLGHRHISLVRVHWLGHVHGMWITMWAEHELMPSVWGLCITLVLATPLHFIYTLHGYWICSRGMGGPS